MYAIGVWGSADYTNLNHLITLQERAVSMITYLDKRQPDFALPCTEPLFLRLGFLEVQELLKLKISKFIYNCINKHNTTNFHFWFKLTTQTHNHNTRSKCIDIGNSRTATNLFIQLLLPHITGLNHLKFRDLKLGI